MAGLKRQACGVRDLASASRCPDRALVSKHSNQNEKPDLGQESDANDRDRKENVARRERVHECVAPSEAPGVNHSGEKMFRFQTHRNRASLRAARQVLRRSVFAMRDERCIQRPFMTNRLTTLPMGSWNSMKGEMC